MPNNDDLEDVTEMLMELSDYYSTITGRNVELGYDEDLDFWLESGRTNGREYFDEISEVEHRVRMLYSDKLGDDYLNGESEAY